MSSHVIRIGQFSESPVLAVARATVSRQLESKKKLS